MNNNCYNTNCPWRSNETSNPTYCACCACPNRESQDYIIITTDHTLPITCKDCSHLMFSDCYGECSLGYKGIVRPNDSCPYGERKE